jgi:hypothetical protein
MPPTRPAKRTPAMPKRLVSTDLNPADAGAAEEEAELEGADVVREVDAPAPTAGADDPLLVAWLDEADDVAEDDDAEVVLITVPEDTTWS